MKLSTLSANRGFTLIELLVVVLIIGILAAIAFPQYQFAVRKSALMAITPTLRSLGQAQKRHCLATGYNTITIEDLDVAIDYNTTEDMNISPAVQMREYNTDWGYFRLSSPTAGCNPTQMTISAYVNKAQAGLALYDPPWMYDGKAFYNTCVAVATNTEGRELCAKLGPQINSTQWAIEN